MAQLTIPLGGSESSSIVVSGESLVGLDVPAMEATTVKLLVQRTVTSLDAVAVPDASCTWRQLYDGQGAKMAIPLPATPEALSVGLVPDFLLVPGRIRLVAADSSDVAVVQTAAKAITPYLRRVR